MREKRTAYNILVENLKGRDHSEDLGVEGRISEWISGAKLWIACIWPRTGNSGGLF
jgi:hypothetical protein